MGYQKYTPKPLAMRKFITDPAEWREQLIGADRRSIDRALFNKSGLPKCITVALTEHGPALRFRFNAVGWPKKHQVSYSISARVDTREEFFTTYERFTFELCDALKLPRVAMLALLGSAQDVWSAYDHYFIGKRKATKRGVTSARK